MSQKKISPYFRSENQKKEHDELSMKIESKAKFGRNAKTKDIELPSEPKKKVEAAKQKRVLRMY